MKHYLLILLISTFFLSCKDVKNQQVKKINTKKEITDTIDLQKVPIKLKIEKLETEYSFRKLLKTIKNIKHTGKKHSDMLTNSSAGFVHDIFGLKEIELSVKTTSYEYKKDLVFYVHTIKHKNDTISIKPFLENAQGKKTKGYLGERILIFAMKNNKEANFIDIPEKLNPLKLRRELTKILYEKIDSDVILCFYTEKCKYKDLRK